MTRRVVGCARPGGRFRGEVRACRWPTRRCPCRSASSSARASRSSARPRCHRRPSRIRACSTGSSSTSSWAAGSASAHVDQVRERGDYLMVELGRESVFVVADDDGVPHAFLNTCRHRGARIVQDARGPPPARAMPLPRLVLRLRRLAAQRAAHRRDRGLRPAVLRAARRPRGRRRGHRHDRPVGQAPEPDEHVGDMAPLLARYRSAACAAPSGSSTRSTPTGRRSPRTTASACTARASIPSSTSSATTCRARR